MHQVTSAYYYRF